MGVTARHDVASPSIASSAKGYVVRLRDAADRRKVHVRLTGAGVRVREAVVGPRSGARRGARRRDCRAPTAHAPSPAWRCWRAPPRSRCTQPRANINPTWPKEALDDSLGPTDRCRSGRSRRARGSRRRQPSQEAHHLSDVASWRCRRRPCTSLLVNVDGYPAWRRDLRKLERLPDRYGMPAWVEHDAGRDAFRSPSSEWIVHRCSWSASPISHCRSAARGRIA